MDEWVIEVQWGFGTKWNVLSASSFGSEEEAQSVIAGMRKLASAPGAHPAHIAYRDLPLRVAKLEVRSE